MHFSVPNSANNTQRQLKMALSTYNLAKTNLAFRHILNELMLHQSYGLDKVKESLDLEVKYELIRLKSDGVIKFESGQIILLEKGIDILSNIPAQTLLSQAG